MSPTKCASHHFGPWMIEPEWFRNAVASAQAGLLDRVRAESEAADEEGGGGSYRWQVDGDMAVLPIAGAMMKIRSKFGGTSTVDVRQALREAVADDRVRSIMLHVDSPGGTVAGTDALARDVAAANQQKPVYAHIEDLGASAAYYVASQARRITASPTSLVGSLGTRMEIIDSHEWHEKQGIKVHDVSTGEFKGAGLEGTQITDRQLAYFQDIVNEGTRHFKDAVMAGRGLTQEKVDMLFDGKVHDADKAKAIGLIDAVESFSAAVQAAHKETLNMNREQFDAFAAEHPEAVASFIEQGKKAGKAEGIAEERARSVAILDACAVSGLPRKGIEAGHDIDTVKLAVDAAKEAEAKAKTEAEAGAKAQAEQAQKIADLQAKLQAAQELASGQGAVGTAGAVAKVEAERQAAQPKDLDKIEDPKARADAEWEADHEKCKAAFSSRERYIAYRSAELAGRMRTLTKPAE